MRAYFIKSLVGLLDEAPIININITRLGNKVIASPSSGLRWDVNVAHWPYTQIFSDQIQNSLWNVLNLRERETVWSGLFAQVFNGTL